MMGTIGFGDLYFNSSNLKSEAFYEGYQQALKDIEKKKEDDYQDNLEASKLSEEVLRRLDEEEQVHERYKYISKIISEGLDDDFLLELTDFSEEIKSKIEDFNPRNLRGKAFQYNGFNVRYYSSYENDKYICMQVRFSNVSSSKERYYYQLYDREANTVVLLSDKIEYLGNDIFMRFFNGKTTFVKNGKEIETLDDKEKSIDLPLIKRMSKISDSGCAVFYGENGMLGLIDFDYYESIGHPIVKNFGYVHEKAIGRVFEVNNQNQSHVVINNHHVVLDYDGEMVYYCKDDRDVYLQDDEFFEKKDEKSVKCLKKIKD